MRRNVTFERAGIALQATVKRDVVWELKYWGLRALNKDKFELLFNTMNEKYLPLMYSFVFCRVFIVLVDFRLHCVTTVTPFIRRSQGWSLRSGRDPGRVTPKTVLFRGNSNPLQFFQLQPKKETSSSSLHYQLKKSFILSLPNRTICAVLWGPSGFPLKPVTAFAPTS